MKHIKLKDWRTKFQTRRNSSSDFAAAAAYSRSVKHEDVSYILAQSPNGRERKRQSPGGASRKVSHPGSKQQQK